MRRSWTCLLMLLVAALLVTPNLSSAAVIVIDDFDDSNYGDDGLLFDTRTVASDLATVASIGGGALGVLTANYPSSGFVILTYATNSTGIDMTAAGGFELGGVFIGLIGQTLTWAWTARDSGGAVKATETGSWTAGDQPLFMGPDISGDYTGWKTLEFRFDWTLEGLALSLSASRLVAVPEPGTLALCGLGVLGMVSARYRRICRSRKQG